MIKTDILQLLRPVITELGYQLWGCEYVSQGRQVLLRVYIDKEGGISITDCEKVSRQVSSILDVEDLIEGNYRLEISSPGIPRPLFFKEQYERYVGKSIQVKLYTLVNGRRKMVGTILSVDDNSVTLHVDGTDEKIPLSQIVKANLIGE